MSQQQYTCPVHSRHTQDIVGCGATFQATPSSDGLVECPQCGMWFAPPVFTVFCRLGDSVDIPEELTGELTCQSYRPLS